MNTLIEVPGYELLKEDLAKIEEKVVLGYTLADAMREGARHTNQASRTFINSEENEVCALAAAGLAMKARFDA